MKARSPTVVLLALVVLVLSAPAVQAVPITIDFNLPAETILSDQYLAQGAVFSGYDFTDRPLVVGVWGPDPAGTVALDSYCNGAGYMQVDFVNPTNRVSADFRLFEGAAPLRLELFAADGTSLGSTSVAGVNLIWYTLSFQTAEANVAYARLSGVNQYNVNAVQFDNVTFESSVPEPASTLLLLGTALAGLGAARRK